MGFINIFKLSSKQHHWLTSATSSIYSSAKKLNQTQGSWVQKQVCKLLCCAAPPPPLINFFQWENSWKARNIDKLHRPIIMQRNITKRNVKQLEACNDLLQLLQFLHLIMDVIKAKTKINYQGSGYTLLYEPVTQI